MSSVKMLSLSPVQVLTGLRRGEFSVGRALERDFYGSPGVQAAVWQYAAEAHAKFWSKWAPWRHAPPGAVGGSFHDILGLFGLEARLGVLMDLRSDDLVVDLGCGPVWMVQFLPPGVVYLGVDSDDTAVARGRKELHRLGVVGRVIQADLMHGLPEEASAFVAQAVKEGQRVRGLARWSLYFPLPVILQIVEQLFQAGAKDLTVDHITAGKFNPLALLVHFIPFLAAGWMRRRLTTEQVVCALKALTKMIPYGVEFKKLFPLWSVTQLAEELEKAGYQVEVLKRPLWEQTTFLQVRR